MSKSKITLSGEYKGVKKLRPLKRPDIISSHFIGRTFKINWIRLCKNGSGDYYIYHSFDELNDVNDKIIYSGRTYDLHLDINDITFNHHERKISKMIPSYEDETSDNLEIQTDCELIVHFSEKGWKKLRKFLDIYLNLLSYCHIFLFCSANLFM